MKQERKMVELYGNSKRMDRRMEQNSPLEPTKKVFKLTLYLTRCEATHKHKFIKKNTKKAFRDFSFKSKEESSFFCLVSRTRADTVRE